jgi:hypothetical protein
MWIVFSYCLGIDIVPQDTSLMPETIIALAATGLDVTLEKKTVFQDEEWDIKIVASATEVTGLGHLENALIIYVTGPRISELEV